MSSQRPNALNSSAPPADRAGSSAFDATPRGRVVAWSALAVIFGVFAWVTAAGVRPYAGGSDSSGYISEARMFRRGVLTVSQRVVPGMESANGSGYLYVPLGFKPTSDGRLTPTYPPGVPLLYAGCSAVLGAQLGVAAAMWLHSVAALILTWLLLRRCGVGTSWSLGALALFAASPLLLFMTMLPMSDVPSLAWVTAAVLCAESARRRPGWSWAAGFTLSIAVLIRPTNILAILPVGLLLGLDWRKWVRLAVAGLPAAVFLMAINQSLNGSPFRSGYPEVWELFGARYLLPSVRNYATQLPVVLTPLVLLGFAALRPPAGTGRLWLAFAGWAAVFFGFYAFYSCTPETWWYLRYVLPAFPVLVAGMAVGAGRVLGSLKGWRCAALGLALLAGALAWQRYEDLRLGALVIGNQERGYALGCERAKTLLPSNAVVLSMQTSGALLYYTDFTFLRWDFMGAKDFELLAKVAAHEHRPIYAILFPFEVDTVTKRPAVGRWTNVETLGQVSIWRWEK